MKTIICVYFFLFINQIKSGIVNIIDENNSEPKYNNELYLNSYKIPSTMMLFKANGNSLDEHPLKNAFDGSFDTFWESLNPQEDTFINNIEIFFSKTIPIDRILYQAPSFNDIIGEGYPTELKIYFKLR